MADGTDGGRLLLALAMASEIAGTVGWDADEVALATLRAMPRGQVARLRSGAAVIVAAADEVLAEGP